MTTLQMGRPVLAGLQSEGAAKKSGAAWSLQLGCGGRGFLALSRAAEPASRRSVNKLLAPLLYVEILLRHPEVPALRMLEMYPFSASQPRHI